MISVDTGKKLTFRDFENESNRVANWARNQNIKVWPFVQRVYMGADVCSRERSWP